MRVYFVRHGQTELNARHIHQPVDTHLSALGLEQAEKLAEQLQGEGIDAILSSDLPRAVATAEKIATATAVPVERMQELRELRRPNSLYGRSHFHPKTLRYVLSLIQNHNKVGWHYEDGESLYEAVERASGVAEKLESISTVHSNVVVVSHSIFLELLISSICADSHPRAKDYLPIFSPFSRLKNTSVTALEFLEHDNSGVCGWLPVLYNDTSHLRA